MINYTDQECIVCKEKFKDGDDVVVCPDCGTPYHRECYVNVGHCMNTELHEQNKSWQREEKAQQTQKNCLHCGTENNSDALVCYNCGASFVDEHSNSAANSSGSSQQNNSFNFGGFRFDPSDRYCGIDPDEKLNENFNVSEAADYIGTNVPYYLLLFKRMKDTGKKLTFNAVCILFPQFYFAYRKMWLFAIAMVLLDTVFSLPSLIYTFHAMEIPMRFVSTSFFDGELFRFLMQFANYASIGINVLCCFFGNWLYYKSMATKIRSIKRVYTDESTIREKIIVTGGTSGLMLVVSLALQFLLSAAVVFAFVKL